MYKFQPSLLPTVSFILLLPIFLKLGFWQLDRAEQKERLYQDYIGKRNSSVVSLDQLVKDSSNIEDMIWRKVGVKGRFVEDINILLDNKIVNTDAGYYVYKPLQLESNNKIIMLNFGWVSANKRRNVIPDLKTFSESEVHIGHIKYPQFSGIKLGKTEIEEFDKNTFRVQNIDFSQLEEKLKLKLEPFVVRVVNDSQQGYFRIWPEPGNGKEKHYGYAFQWFSFATILCFLFVYLNLKKNV